MATSGILGARRLQKLSIGSGPWRIGLMKGPFLRCPDWGFPEDGLTHSKDSAIRAVEAGRASALDADMLECTG